MQEKILDFLRKAQNYASGEEISQRLGISRQALWKHIQEFKELGYDIVAVPHLGYRLISSPDRLLPAEISHHLNTKFIGKKIYYFESVSSTMDVAGELGLKDAPEGTLIVSESQNKGRGRLGRTWSSPKYKGIYLSLILKPKILPHQVSILTLLSAVSIVEAIKEITGLEAQIKWPNDILIHHKKLGGILTELNAQVDAIRFVVIGIGINVNNDKKTLLSNATSLKEQKKENISRMDLLRELLRKLESSYLLLQEKGNAPLVEKWEHYNVTLGKRVKIICQNRRIEGLADRIDLDGGLLIRKDSGVTEKVTSGDVELLANNVN